jgi:hypothetical protein
MQEPYLQRRAKLTVKKQLPKKMSGWTGKILSYSPYLYHSGYNIVGEDKYDNVFVRDMRKQFVSEVIDDETSV